MKNRLFILIILAIWAFAVHGQDKKTISMELSSAFYCTGWLFEFPDTLKIYNQNEKTPKYLRYSEISKNDKGYYDLYCWDWDGEIFLLNPIVLTKDKLNLKFKDNIVTFKIGHIKCAYVVNHINGRMMLIKKNPNDHRKAAQGNCELEVQK